MLRPAPAPAPELATATPTLPRQLQLQLQARLDRLRAGALPVEIVEKHHQRCDVVVNLAAGARMGHQAGQLQDGLGS